jgi:hypothetical protein
VIAKLRDNLPEMLWACAILILALFVRIYRLGEIPSLVAPDGLDTLSTYLQWQKYGVTPLLRVNWNGASFTNTIIFGGSVEYFNGALFGLRFPAAIASAVVVCLVFVSLRVLEVQRVIAGLISLALATNPVLLNFSREAWENVFTAIPMLFWVVGVVWVSRGGELRRPGVILLILAPALGLCAYHPGKILWAFGLVAPFIFLRRQLTRKELWLIPLGAALCSSVPLIGMLYSSYQAFHRIGVVSIFSAASPWSQFINNLQVSGGALFLLSPSPVWQRYGPNEQPLVSQLFLPFLLLGFLQLFKSHRSILALLGALFFIPQLFSTGALDIARAVHVIPLMYLCIGVGLSAALNWCTQAASLRAVMRSPYLRAASVIPQIGFFAACSLLLFVTYKDLRLYSAWVESPASKEARHPAVLVEEFPIWYEEIRASILSRGAGFDGAGWQEIRRRRQLSGP